MSFSSSNTCVYTCLMGGYEKLNEQPLASDSGIPFYCLTDDPALTSETWRIIPVSPVFPADSVRSQRSLKILPPIGEGLPPVECSLYIDNSVILSRPPAEILDTCLGSGALAVPNHSFRERVIDEFEEVRLQGLDDQTRIFEQLNHYALSAPQVLEERPYFTAMLMRRHQDAGVRRMMELWHAHVLRYSRRDQLSINMAGHLAGILPTRLDLDTCKSWCHSWPVVSGRERNHGLRNPLTSVMPLAIRVRELEGQLNEVRQKLALPLTLEAEVARLAQSRRELSQQLQERKQEVRAMRASLSWRLTRPLRSLQQRLSGKGSAMPAAPPATGKTPG